MPQFLPNPPVRIVRLVAPGKGFAQAGEVVEEAVADGGLDFVFGDDLDRAVGEGERFEGHGGDLPLPWFREG